MRHLHSVRGVNDNDELGASLWLTINNESQLIMSHNPDMFNGLVTTDIKGWLFLSIFR